MSELIPPNSKYLLQCKCGGIWGYPVYFLSENGYFVLLSAVRTALVALIAFMPTEPGRALGALDYPKEVRRALALKSREAPPKFGNPERQTLINEVSSA